MSVRPCKQTHHPLEQMEDLMEQGLVFEVSRLPDAPIGKGDQVVGTDVFGHVLIARAPICLE